MLETSSWPSIEGTSTVSFPAGTTRISVCVHSDFPGSENVARAVREAIDDVKAGVA